MKNFMTLLFAAIALTALVSYAQQPTGKEATSPTAPVTPELNSPLPSNVERVPEQMLKKSPLNQQNNKVSAEDMVRQQQFKESYGAAKTDQQRQEVIRKYHGDNTAPVVNTKNNEAATPQKSEAEKISEQKHKTARSNDKREKAFGNKFNQANSDEKVSMCRQMRERCEDGKSNSCLRIDEYCKGVAKTN